MNKLLVLVPIFFVGYACNNPTPDSPKAVEIKKANLPPDTSGKKRSLFDSKEGYVLSYKTDSLEQRLKLVQRNKEAMDFCLILTNSIEKVSDTLNGRLTYVQSGGDENESADDGSGFFFDDWNYTDKNGCQMNFVIDSDSAHYVHIYDFDCAKKLKTPIPLETKHYLKRVDIL